MKIVDAVGAACFGLVVGWITYRTLRRREDKASLKDISAVVGVVGGGGVVSLFEETSLFSWYAIGLAAGFFLYLAVASLAKGESAEWLGTRSRE
ncbi:hypothetical protein JS756_31250 [Streptomyces actuosus]|uniref:Uncharacterized protein n=1 Tax=Streptomyces actuosus TaxID=1885 RepID=A0ABS2VZB4_STRAS|nr:hypothetical protein [Streptomyces actuosus]MBN0048498.1 hypothetical protein [Streptomyces actuosus]